MGKNVYNEIEIVYATCSNIVEMGVQTGTMKNVGRTLLLLQVNFSSWWLSKMDTPRRRVSRKRAVSQEGKTPKKSRGGNRKPAEVLSPQDLNKTTVGNPRPLFASSPKKQQDKWLENSFVNNNIVPGTPQQTALNTSTQLLFSPDHIYSQVSCPGLWELSAIERGCCILSRHRLLSLAETLLRLW